MLLQYRAVALAGFGTQVFWGLIRVMIFDAFYRSTNAPQPMTYEDVVTYVWLGQAFLVLILWGVESDIRQMIRSGTVAYELLRPLDLYTFWFSRSLATRSAPMLLRAVPMFVVAGLCFGMRPPPSLAFAVLWVIATVGALFLACALTTLLSISLFWTISGEGLARIVPSLVAILSGMIVPLPLFPDWARDALDFLPFRGLVDVPFRIYLGHIPLEEIAPLLFHQAMWTAAIVLLGRWMLARGARRLVVQGG